MCDEHTNPYECPDYVIAYSPEFDEYGLIVHDGGSSSYLIRFCPFCGNKLPESKRDMWFENLEKLGFDDPYSQKIPSEYETDRWYRS